MTDYGTPVSGKMWASFFEKLTALNSGEMDETERHAFYQEMVDTGLLDQMSDEHKEMARKLLADGKIRRDPPVTQAPKPRLT